MRHLWVTTFLLLALGGTAHAETAGERAGRLIAADNIVLKTDDAPVFTARSTACPASDVTADIPAPGLIAQWRDVPLPCGFQAADSTDHDAILNWRGRDPRYCEFWLGHWGAAGFAASWGGCARPGDLQDHGDGILTWPPPYGAASSGIALGPLFITPQDLARGRIGHALALAVPETCATWRPPANRTDGGTWGTFDENPNCLENGTRLYLPRTARPITWGSQPAPPLSLMVIAALKRYGMVVMNQTHDVAAIYAQGFSFPGSPGDPYPDLFTRGYPCAAWPRYCVGWGLYPDGHNQLEAVPWGDLTETRAVKRSRTVDSADPAGPRASVHPGRNWHRCTAHLGSPARRHVHRGRPRPLLRRVP